MTAEIIAGRHAGKTVRVVKRNGSTWLIELSANPPMRIWMPRVQLRLVEPAQPA